MACDDDNTVHVIGHHGKCIPPPRLENVRGFPPMTLWPSFRTHLTASRRSQYRQKGGPGSEYRWSRNRNPVRRNHTPANAANCNGAYLCHRPLSLRPAFAEYLRQQPLLPSFHLQYAGRRRRQIRPVRRFSARVRIPQFVTPEKAGVQGAGEGKCSAGACPPLGSGRGAAESTAPIRYTKPILIPWSAGDLTHANRTLRPAGVAAKLALHSAMRAPSASPKWTSPAGRASASPPCASWPTQTTAPTSARPISQLPCAYIGTSARTSRSSGIIRAGRTT